MTAPFVTDVDAGDPPQDPLRDVRAVAQPPVAVADGLSAVVAPGRMSFQGEIDLSNASVFRQTVATQARRQGCVFVIDLTELRFLDSAGIGALYTLSRETDMAISVAVRAGSVVDRVLEMGGTSRALTIERLPA